jgi:hypothetical protein
MAYSKAKLNSNGDKAGEYVYGRKTEICAYILFVCYARYVVLNQMVYDNAGILKVSFEFSRLFTHLILHKITSILLHTLQYSGVLEVSLRAPMPRHVRTSVCPSVCLSVRPSVRMYQLGPGWIWWKVLLYCWQRHILTCISYANLRHYRLPQRRWHKVTLCVHWLWHRAGQSRTGLITGVITMYQECPCRNSCYNWDFFYYLSMPHHSKVILHAVINNVQFLALPLLEVIKIYWICKFQKLFQVFGY